MSELHAALLMSDIVDSTALGVALGDDEMSRLWAAHDEVSRTLIRRWRGVEIDRTDGFFLTFVSADDALGFACDFHRATALLRPPLRARVGIHFGRHIVREASASDRAQGAKRVEIDGVAKPITARIMSVARGGQTLLSAEASRSLGTGQGQLHSHGHWMLKGLREPLELFEAVDQATPFEPPDDADKAYRVELLADGGWTARRRWPHSLPAERDAFVGRRRPMRELYDWFETGARIVSLLGPGGVGKTRLAQRFAWAWLGDHPGGAWFCDLAQARNADELARAVALGLGLPLTSNSPIDQIGNAIAGRGRCLVILDNFEQVGAFAELTLGAWVDKAPEARFIVTSREVLGIRGEVVVALAPLDEVEGVGLFTRRAAEANGKQQIAPSEHDTLAKLVNLLDGLPLAIELAAARSRVHSPRQLLERMSERFALLASTGGRSSRHATLRATLDWSWELLSSAERAALARLSVFEGAFDVPAAAAVLAEAGGAAGELHEWLQALHDKSLLRQVGNGRFTMLASVRDYAAEALRTPGRLAASGDDAVRATELRHARHFASFDSLRATSAAREELDDLVVACRRAARWSDESLAVRALLVAWAALRLRGPFGVGRELADACRQMPGLGDRSRAVIERVAGASHQKRGSIADARRHFDLALPLARAVADVESEAWCLASMAELELQAGELERAGSLYTEALSKARAAVEPLLVCVVLSGHAAYLERTHQHADAGVEYRRALAAARDAGDRRSEGGCLGNLGQFLVNQGEPAEANRLIRDSLAIAQELGDRHWEGNALCNLGLLEQEANNLPEALELLNRSLRIARDLGHVRLECIVLCNLGLVHDSASRGPEAESCLREAIRVARGLDDRRSEGQFEGYLGRCLSRQGQSAAAQHAFARAVALSEAAADQWNLGLVWCRMAEAAAGLGHVDAARTSLEQAAALARELDVPAQSEFGVALMEASNAVNQAGSTVQ